VKPLRIAVVGVGHMGRHHARTVAELEREGAGVRLAGVVDVDVRRARRIAEEFGTLGSVDHAGVYAGADAAIVAVPTVAHFSVARAALAVGLDVLVEKPIAASVEEGERLLAEAKRRGAVMRVGHQEWFNPAMDVVREYVRKPRFIEGHRIGPFPARGTDVDVVRDLMIHDIDILQRLLGEEPVRVEAVGVPVITDQIDIANARLSFPCGCIADLTASRVAVSSMRKLRFFQREASWSVDFLNPSAVVFRRLVDGSEAQIGMDEIKIERRDALRGQLRAFSDAARARDVTPAAGVDALRALRTALRVVDAMPSSDARP
jgi:predicted dehydrogenase